MKLKRPDILSAMIYGSIAIVMFALFFIRGKMIDPDKIFHVYPNNDIKEHILNCEFPAIGELYCSCPCEPDWKKEGEGAIIVHNSFDGREGLEWVTEILNTTTDLISGL